MFTGPFFKKCFNSTLVQLKGDGNNWRSVILYEFQFYLSSIKSYYFLEIIFTFIMVSILP